MGKNILFVLHADFERPGVIETWAQEKGISYQICRPFAGEAMPEVATFDWLFLMGGPQSPSEAGQLTYLQDEMDFILEAIKEDKFVLGICLGAQLIGHALGVPVEKSPSKEIGVFPIQLTDSGKNDPLLKGLPDTFSVVHWHNDMSGLTEESILLATSVGCPRQAIRYLPKVYGFQCHLESLKENMEAMVTHCESDLVPDRFVQTKDEILDQDYVKISSSMVTVLENLLQLDPLQTASTH